MSHRPGNRPKLQALRAHGSLNPRPTDVTDSRFADDSFFDPHDMVQVKYEMLRSVRVDHVPVSHASVSFGLSRVSFYQARAKFERDGMAGLVARKPGPQHAHKLTEQVMVFLRDKLREDSSLGASELAAMLERHFGLEVHPRSIVRALEREKKKLL